MSILIFAIVFILVLIGVAHFTKSSAYPVSISWLAGAAGFGLLYTNYLNDIPSVIGVAALTSLGALPFINDEKGVRTIVFGAIPALSVLVLSLLVGEIPTPESTTGIIFVAAFGAAVLGALACLSAASSFAENGNPTSWMLGISGAIAGVFLAGQGRSSLPKSEYGFPIRGPEGKVEYVLEGFRGLENGAKWAVSSPMPNLEIAWIVLGLLALVGGVLFIEHPLVKKIRAATIVLVGCVAGIIAAYLPALIANLSLPDVGAYKDHVQQFLIGKRLPGQAGDDAVFTSVKGLSVSFVDILPELWALSFACVAIAAFALSKFVSKSLQSDSDMADRHRLMIRASIWMWLAWFVAQVLHRSMYGTAGVGASNEWIFLGGALLISGLALLSDFRERAWLKSFSAMTPGLGLGVLFVLFGVASRFSSILGLSVTVF